MSSVANNTVSQSYKYAAFISYARADEPVATRLQKRLETYWLHKSIRAEGQHLLRPIFRDRTELAAHGSIGNAIEDGLLNSRCLIVLCSPDAKASKWVNEEIRLFRKLNPDAQIFSALVDGTPETAFPSELLIDGVEPLAADLSKGASNEKFGTSQLVASLLRVPLDDVLRRDTERRRRTFAILSSLAIGFSTVMAALTLFAVSAQIQAEKNREDAEGLVEFMLTDFEGRLRELGRLDVLSDVGEKVVEYYEDQPIDSMASDRLARRSRARHLLGQVALSTRNMKQAEEEVKAAYDLTQTLLRRSPDDVDLVFAHAQSAYWRGEFEFRLDKTEEVRPFWEEYSELGKVLYETDPDKFRGAMERGWGELNLGALSARQNQMAEAFAHYNNSLGFFEIAEGLQPDNLSPKIERANALAWMADRLLIKGQLADVRHHRRQQLDLLTQIKAQLPKHKRLELEYVTPLRELLILDFLENGKITDYGAWRDYGRVVEELHIHDDENAAINRELCHAHLFPSLIQLVNFESPKFADQWRPRLCQDYLEYQNTFGPVDALIASMWEIPDIGADRFNEEGVDLSAPSEQQKLYVWYLHLKILVEDDRQSKAINLARAILGEAELEPSSAQQLLSEIGAYEVLSKCDEANSKRALLLKRGYAVPDKGSFNSFCTQP